jgi:hypothetical protein
MRRRREVRVTPGMRRKVDDLERWVVAGERSRLAEARRAIVEILVAAARR